MFDRGGFFLAGVPGIGITLNMPLPGILVSSAQHLGATPEHLFIALHLGVYALVFFAGCLLYGYRAGIISLAAAGILGVESGNIYEQTLYSFFLLLVLIFLLLKSRENTLKNSLLCGLAIGASLLVRTPLFLFPPVVVLCDWLYSRERLKKFILRSLAFLAASYALLLPWGSLNHSISGKFDVLDTGRAACNTITAAKGSVFTMEGDCRKAAGLNSEDSAFGFYLREWSKAPFFHLLTVLRRLWAIFLFYPALFVLFLAALALGRRRDKPFVFLLPAYFIFIHSLLSIEVRYFYPLPYLLIPLIAGGFMSRFAPGAGAPCAFAAKGAAAALYLSFCAVLGTEALVLAYPARVAGVSGTDDVFARASSRFPRDGVLHGLKCRELWRNGDDAKFRECLGTRIQGFEDIAGSYFLKVSDSLSPSEIALPAAHENERPFLQGLIIRMLREFELGRREPALASLRKAEGVFNRHYNRLQGNRPRGKEDYAPKQDAEPYEQDRRLAARMGRDPDRFWDSFVYEMLLFWPPQEMSVILSRIGESVPLTGRLKTLSADLAQGLACRKVKEAALRARIAAYWIPPAASRVKAGIPLKEEINGSKALSDSAVEKMRAGELEAAGKLLLEALAVNPSNPEALMSLCSLRARRAEGKEQALKICQEAAAAVYSNPGNMSPGFVILAAEADFESYKLLGELGCKAEAEEALFRAVKNSPPSWPGLAKASAALKNLRH